MLKFTGCPVINILALPCIYDKTSFNIVPCWYLFCCGNSSAFSHWKSLKNHRITERFRSEETFKDDLVQPPCHGQGHLSLDQIAQSPIQTGLEHFQGGDIHRFSGQPVPVPHHPHSKEFLPYI